MLQKCIAKSCLGRVHSEGDGKTTMPISNTALQKCMASDEVVASRVGFHNAHLVLACTVDGMRKEKSHF
jgi:hypothetical protein